MKILIRKYKDSDINEILSVWDKASRLAHPFLSEKFSQNERNNIINNYLPNTESLVAEKEDHIIGFISMLGSEIGGLFVDPDYHGLGTGTALVDKVRAIHDKLIVEVFKDNTIGRKFYSKYGFKYVNEALHNESGKIMYTLQYTKVD